jgi:hypothetical protein
MDKSLSDKLIKAVKKIDRPGSFCVQGSVPAILPGLQVKKLGPIALPLTVKQAKELTEHCQQAPYGKGTETVVDTSVRRVWRMEPDRFALTNPDWNQFVKEIVGRVQEELGLEKQKLEAHLYDLLLYEKGGFFLPHKDGEKLDRMVATLVVVLPSPHEGGELVVRHEGQEEVIDLGGAGANPFQIHYAAFYADCEHEIRPLRAGYRLCLVYNLTLGNGKKAIKAPRAAEHIDEVAALLSKAAEDPSTRKLAITLEHQYTEKGLAWDALKGVDRAVATIVADAAGRAGWDAYLALLTLHESGSAEGGDYDYDYRRRRGRYDDDDSAGEYEMGEVFDSSLTATNGKDRDGNRMPIDDLTVEEEELVDPEVLRQVEPEEDFEGYTGNAGMTLDRWYRHAVLVLWPESRFFEILCAESPAGAVPELKRMVAQWRKASQKNAPALKSRCADLAAAILVTWPDKPYGNSYSESPNADQLFGLLVALGDLKLINTYLSALMLKDVTLDPGKALAEVCQRQGWQTFERQLRAVFKNTSAPTILRNVRVLEHLAAARPSQDDGWSWTCEELGRELVAGLERIDLDKTDTDWRLRELDRKAILPGLVRALIASEQPALLSRVVAHTLAHPKTYPLTVHLAVLADLQVWLKKNVKASNAGLALWLSACREQLEALTANQPKKPSDFRRPATVKCNCDLCRELNQFLANPGEEAHRFMAHQVQRSHLEHNIHTYACDVGTKTEKTRPSHTLVCTKNTKSYEAALKKYHEDQRHLARVREIEAGLPNWSRPSQ